MKTALPARAIALWGLALAACFHTTLAGAVDVVRRPIPESAKGPESDFNGAVIGEALRRTEKRYGAWRYAARAPIFARERMLDEMVRGEAINVTVVATQPSWEEKLLAVRIPIDMGLSSYRVALIDRDNQAQLSAVRELEQLKSLPVGVGTAWASRKLLDAHGFSVVTGDSYEALLKMLMSGRSLYFPRSLNEAVIEQAAHVSAHPDLVIERDLLIESPLPTYVFVSPAAPQLAKRLEEGLQSMVEDGSLHRLVMQHNGELLKQIKLCGRTVFKLGNPSLSANTPLQRKALWIDVLDPRSGLCPDRKTATVKNGT